MNTVRNAISGVEALDALIIAHDFLLNRERRPNQHHNGLVKAQR
ncbi:hypothetical protein [Pseudomonas sp. LAM2023]|jgi:hypothetical protein|nr:hypothetical protein [Pseudomonas sp. LAM2023]